MPEIKSICVYCGSSTGNSPKYIKMATNLGQLLAKNDLRLVYGGGDLGVMGALAKSVVESKGKVLGIIPHALHDVCSGSFGDTILVETMHERKAKMVEESDAFLALPGGLGTMEELLETITWSQLRIHNKAVGVLNIDGFYDLLLKQFDYAKSEGFMDENARYILVSGSTPQEILDKILTYKDPFEHSKDYILSRDMWAKRVQSVPKPKDI